MSASTVLTTMQNRIPQAWKAAYDRDKIDPPTLADPRPERLAASALAAYILAGLFFLAFPGTLLGVWNLLSIAERHAPAAVDAAWIQAHGQAQLFGWVGTFLLGISLYVLPKIQGRGLKRFGWVWMIWTLWTGGVGLRWWAGVGAAHWRIMFFVGPLLECVAYALALWTLIFPPGKRQRKMPADFSSVLGIVGFGGMGIALALDLLDSVRAALNASSPLFPPVADRTFLVIAVWGFVVPLAWGYSARFVTVFLGLKQPAHRAAKITAVGVAGVAFLALFKEFLPADLLNLILCALAIWALRVFLPAERKPKLLAVYHGYPAFVRISFVWLMLGAALGVLADFFPSEAGLGGAGRHAVTVGFIATLIFAIGPRILPSFMNGRELFSPALMGAALWILNLGCLLRVATEAVAYSAGGLAWKLLPYSALLELTAVLLFAANLALTFARPMLAWFAPEDVKDSLAVYWYVSSFPKTRRVMVRSGMKTVAQAREIPRSLTLHEAAEADGVDPECVLANLKEFFRRQPRRPDSAMAAKNA